MLDNLGPQTLHPTTLCVWGHAASLNLPGQPTALRRGREAWPAPFLPRGTWARGAVWGPLCLPRGEGGSRCHSEAQAAPRAPLPKALTPQQPGWHACAAGAHARAWPLPCTSPVPTCFRGRGSGGHKNRVAGAPHTILPTQAGGPSFPSWVQVPLGG